MNTPPALLTRMSAHRGSRWSAANAASTSADSRTSVTMPSPPISSAAAAAVSGLRSQMATLAPKAARPRAMPRPMPAPPPVTTATWSVRRTEDGSRDTRRQYSRFAVLLPTVPAWPGT